MTWSGAWWSGATRSPCTGPSPDGYDPAARVVPLELPPSAGPRDVGAITALRRTLREDPVDVVHAFGLRAGFVAGVARPAGLPLVVSWLGDLGPGGVRRTATLALARLVVASADLTLYAWPELAGAARRLDDDRLRRAPVLAPDLPRPARDRAQVRAEFGLAPDAPLVFSAGRLDPYHHHDVLIAAAARWRELRPHPTVLVAGTGPAYRSLAAQIVHQPGAGTADRGTRRRGRPARRGRRGGDRGGDRRR